jgi:nucleoside-diphosphate-sugar epimerase
MKLMKFLVTGAAGFLGSHLCDRLLIMDIKKISFIYVIILILNYCAMM